MQSYTFTLHADEPTMFRDHVAHNGQTCVLVRALDDTERDPEVGQMYVARFADGVELHVFADELDPMP